MSKLIFFLVLATVFSAIFCQKPVPCVAPPQWRARLFEFNDEAQFMLRGKISYDSVNTRERIREEYTLGQDQESYDLLFLYQNQTQYRFNQKYRNCTKEPLTRTWKPMGIDANATNYGESFIGSSAVANASVLTTLWGSNFTDDKGNQWSYYSSWTLTACIPVEATYFSATAGHYHQFFVDVEPGVPDPDEFTPRKECLQL